MCIPTPFICTATGIRTAAGILTNPHSHWSPHNHWGKIRLREVSQRWREYIQDRTKTNSSWHNCMLAESWKAYSGRFAKSSTFRSKLFCNPAMTICNVSVFNACFNATRLCDNIQLKYPHSEVSCSAILPHLGVHSHSCFNATRLYDNIQLKDQLSEVNCSAILPCLEHAFKATCN